MAAAHDLGVARLALEEALDASELVGVVQRPERRVRRVRVTHHEALGLLGEPADDVVVDPRAGEHARGGGAVLAGVVVAGARDRLERRLHVDVVEHDHRGLAAQLEVHALQGRGCGLRDLLAGGHVAGERDHRHAWMADDACAYRLAVAGDHVEHARGQDVRRQLR